MSLLRHMLRAMEFQLQATLPRRRRAVLGEVLIRRQSRLQPVDRLLHPLCVVLHSHKGKLQRSVLRPRPHGAARVRARARKAAGGGLARPVGVPTTHARRKSGSPEAQWPQTGARPPSD